MSYLFYKNGNIYTIGPNTDDRTCVVVKKGYQQKSMRSNYRMWDVVGPNARLNQQYVDDVIDRYEIWSEGGEDPMDKT